MGGRPPAVCAVQIHPLYTNGVVCLVFFLDNNGVREKGGRTEMTPAMGAGPSISDPCMRTTTPHPHNVIPASPS